MAKRSKTTKRSQAPKKKIPFRYVTLKGKRTRQYYKVVTVKRTKTRKGYKYEKPISNPYKNTSKPKTTKPKSTKPKNTPPPPPPPPPPVNFADEALGKLNQPIKQTSVRRYGKSFRRKSATKHETYTINKDNLASDTDGNLFANLIVTYKDKDGNTRYVSSKSVADNELDTAYADITEKMNAYNKSNEVMAIEAMEVDYWGNETDWGDNW
jgi:hypothetical protein